VTTDKDLAEKILRFAREATKTDKLVTSSSIIDGIVEKRVDIFHVVFLWTTTNLHYADKELWNKYEFADKKLRSLPQTKPTHIEIISFTEFREIQKQKGKELEWITGEEIDDGEGGYELYYNRRRKEVIEISWWYDEPYMKRIWTL
jgi:hypothetical protein